MNVHHPARRTSVLSVSLILMLPGLVGCPTATTSSNFIDEDGNASVGSATAVDIRAQGSTSFRGSIDGLNDIDVFDIGVFAPGESVLIDVQRLTGDLDAILAVFDADEEILAFNDDRELDASDQDPLMDFTMRGQTSRLFIAVAAFQGFETLGEYEVTLTINRNGEDPGPQPATLFLNWAGGRIDIETIGNFTIPPFNATQVGFSSSDTAQLKDLVEDVIADRYAGYNLIILNSDDNERPSEPHAVVHFGGNSQVAFGLAEQIDVWNADPGDEAVIYVETFADSFIRNPSLSEMGVALGNTAAHEFGHLLGLVHVHDCFDIMDATCSNDALFNDQSFDRSPVDRATFPIGWQNATEWLESLLGLDLSS